MARNLNVSSAVFGAQAMTDPINFKAVATGEIAPNSAGVDVGISSQVLVNRRGELQVSFNDLATALLMLINEFGEEKTLVLKTPNLSQADTTITIINCLCKEVLIDAQHNDYGAHIALFEARYVDGSTNPFSSS